MIELRLILLSLILSTSISSIYGQELASRLISYDFETEVFDTLDAVEINTEKSFEFTQQKMGENIFEEAEFPTSIEESINQLVPLTRFTKPLVATDYFELEKYPVSTVVKLFNTNNDGMGDLCSGVMISDRHVLSSAHCIFAAYTTNVNISSVEARIFYDATHDIERTYGSKVKKIYFIEDWNLSFGEDLAVFELEENIGVMSGWMSIGYNEDDEYFQDRHMHKFAYPAFTTPFNDYPYNGDTLYYSHGHTDFVNENFIGVQQHLSGVGGESGSPIFEHTEGENCIVYGVLTWLGNYSHSRMTRDRYYAITSLLGDTEVSTFINEAYEDLEINLYPNPATSVININFNVKPPSNTQVKVIDVIGNVLHQEIMNRSKLSIDISNMPVGMLFLHISHENQIVSTRPFLKY